MHPIHFLTLPFAESHLNARNYPTSKETKETNLNEGKQTNFFRHGTTTWSSFEWFWLGNLIGQISITSFPFKISKEPVVLHRQKSFPNKWDRVVQDPMNNVVPDCRKRNLNVFRIQLFFRVGEKRTTGSIAYKQLSSTYFCWITSHSAFNCCNSTLVERSLAIRLCMVDLSSCSPCRLVCSSTLSRLLSFSSWDKLLSARRLKVIIKARNKKTKKTKHF